jgi:DNA-binding ferritin-like protein (Dps family)
MLDWYPNQKKGDWAHAYCTEGCSQMPKDYEQNQNDFQQNVYKTGGEEIRSGTLQNSVVEQNQLGEQQNEFSAKVFQTDVCSESLPSVHE